MAYDPVEMNPRSSRSLEKPGTRARSNLSRSSTALDLFPQVPVSLAVTDERCKELGGKLIGQPTRIMRGHFKFDESTEAESESWNGSSPGRVLRGFKNAWYAPVRWYLDTAYTRRPSLTSKEARAEQWGALHAPDRYLLALMVGFGPPGYFFYNTRYPLALVTLLIILNCVYETVAVLYPQYV